MRIKVGSAIYQSKALFKGNCPSIVNFNSIKGLLCNLQKKVQQMNGSTILDGLNNFRCDSFRNDSEIIDAAKICMDKHARISQFSTFSAA